MTDPKKLFTLACPEGHQCAVTIEPEGFRGRLTDHTATFFCMYCRKNYPIPPEAEQNLLDWLNGTLSEPSDA